MTNSSGNCTKCGAALKPGVRFCEACGAAVAASPRPAPPPQPVPPTPVPPAASLTSTPAPAALAPPKSSAGIVIGVICAVLLVALLAVVLVWVAKGKKPPAVAGGGRQTAAVPDAPPTAKPTAPKPNGNTAYLPAPGLRLTYHEQFADGDEGDWELVTTQLNGKVELSCVECLDSYATAGDNDVATMHYLSDAGGIWKVEDIRPENRELLLPALIKPGATFSSEGVNGKIVAIGKTCDLGFTTFTDCLVVQRTYGAGYQETEYFAPGHGIVMTKAGNATMRKLTAITRMDENAATAFVKRHTKWQKALGE